MSNTHLKTYTTTLLVVGVVLAIASSLGQYFYPTIMHPLWFIELAFVIAIQWLAFVFLQKHTQNIKTLMQRYQTAKLTKLFLYLIALVCYVFVVKDYAFQFLIDFLVYYVVFIVLEMFFLQRWMKSLSKAEETK
ncbi:MAG: hypothetical protein LBU91_07360 [Bacteroidales bacterium]|jgi:hypothetical protein|nr:hypothetical protein [Bacteroidales bacterium]